MAKVIYRQSERVKCPHDVETRRTLAKFALEQREKIREFRLQMEWFDSHPEGAPPVEARKAAFRDYAAGLRWSYRELREKMEIFSVDMLDQFEAHVGRLAAGNRSSELTVGGYIAGRRRVSRGLPPKRRRAR